MNISPDIIRKVKLKIRISHNVLDEEVEDTIVECLADLKVCGVRAEAPEEDPLIRSAVKLYCKAEFTEDADKAEKYMARYDALKSCLMMADGYREATGDE